MAAVDLYRAGLPAPWRYAVCNDGRIFFINEETRTTTWLHPITAHPTNSGAFFSTDLPRGWEKNLTEQGLPYYIDHINERTTIQHPVSGQFTVPLSPHHHHQSPTTATSPRSPANTGQAHSNERGHREGRQRKRTSSVNKNEKSKVVDKLPVVKRRNDSSISMQGWLYKQEGKGLKHWKRRWFVLTDFCLFYYRDHHEADELGSILLPSYAINVCNKDDGIARKYAFKAEHQNMKTHYFGAETREEMAHWMNALILAATVQRDPNLERQYMDDDEDAGFVSHQRIPYTPNNRMSGEWMDAQRGQSGPTAQQPHQAGPAWMRGQHRPQHTSPDQQVNRIGNPQQQQQQPNLEAGDWKQSNEPRPPVRDRYEDEDDDGGFIRRHAPDEYQTQGENLMSVANTHQRAGKTQGRSTQKELQEWYRNKLQQPPPGGDRRNRQQAQPVAAKKSAAGGGSGRDADATTHRYFEPLTIETGAVYENMSSRHAPMNANHGPMNTSHGAMNTSHGAMNTSHGPMNVSHGPLNATDGPVNTSSPGRPPLPAAYRGRYVQQMASEHTPRTQRDMINAVTVSEQREHEPNYFRYPSNNPQLVKATTDNYTNQMPAANSHVYRQHLLPSADEPQTTQQQGRDDRGVLTSDEGRRAAAEIGERERLRLQKYIDRSHRGENGLPPPQRSDVSSLAAQMNKWNGLEGVYRQEGGEMKRYDDSVSSSDVRRDVGYNGDDRFNWDERQLLDWQTSHMSEHAAMLDENENIVGGLKVATPRHSYIELSPSGLQSLDRLQQETRVTERGSPGSHQVSAAVEETPAAVSSRPGKHELTSPVTSQSLGDSYLAPPAARPPPTAYNIDTIPESPNQRASDIIETKLPLGGGALHGGNLAGLRLSVCASDLVGKSHEELVLLLIELRRNQARLEAARVYYTQQLDLERSYLSDVDACHSDNPTVQELLRQKDYVHKELNMHKPLVNLLDNLVTMGSLYGGDNLMLASQYKKDRLKPHQYTSPKPLIEFSRHHQEEQLAQAQRDDLKAVSEDQVDLEEKLQRLYASDRTLQEKSLAITSLQQDKHLLENALAETRNNLDSQPQQSVTWRHLVQQLRGIEMKLLHVRQQLADESKRMEEFSAENSRLEHEVVALRSKILGLNNSLLSPSAQTQESTLARRQLEGEVHGITSLITGLSQQGEQLSHVMNSLSRGGQPAEPQSSKVLDTKPGRVSTYIETDMDTGHSHDISVVHHLAQHQSPQHQVAPDVLHNEHGASHTRPPFTSPAHRHDNLPASQVHPNVHDGAAPYWSQLELTEKASMSPLDRTDYSEDEADEMMMSDSHDFNDADDNTKRFYGLLPRERIRSQTVRDVKKKESARRGGRERSRHSSGGHQQEESPVASQPARRSHSLPRRQSSQDSAGEGDSHLDPTQFRHKPTQFRDEPTQFRGQPTQFCNEPTQFHHEPIQFHQESAQFRNDPTQFRDEPTQFRDHPTQFQRSYSARDAVIHASRNSSGVLSSDAPSSTQPATNATSSSSTAPTTNNSEHVRRMSDLYTPRPFKRASSDTTPLPSQVPVGAPPQTVAAVRPMPSQGVRERRGGARRYQTISGGESFVTSTPARRPEELHTTVAGDLISSAVMPREPLPDLVHGETAAKQCLFDDETIEREVLLRPEKVDIPERYVADSDDGILTEDERRFHEEKAKKLRKLLAAQSLQDWSQAELAATHPGWSANGLGVTVGDGGGIHEQVIEEKRRREHVLDMRQVLAREVMAKSRQVAVTKR